MQKRLIWNNPRNTSRDNLVSKYYGFHIENKDYLLKDSLKYFLKKILNCKKH